MTRVCGVTQPSGTHTAGSRGGPHSPPQNTTSAARYREDPTYADADAETAEGLTGSPKN